MSFGLQNSYLVFILFVLGVVAFLTWVMNRQEKNYASHIARSKALYDDQMVATKALYEESNQVRRQMLIALQEIRKVLGSRNN